MSDLINFYDYIIIDIGKVESMNSTLLSSILTYKEKIIICNPTPISLNIFSILGIDKFIKVFRSVDDAIIYIEQGSGVRPTVSHRA
jgi:anti-anti-sigma regulatory factor